MTVGPSVSPTSLNAALTEAANLFRQASILANGIEQFVNSQGANGLTEIGYGPEDIPIVQQDSGYLSTLSGVFFGTAVQATEFNFDNALINLTTGGVIS